MMGGETISLWQAGDIPFDRREILRYAGFPGGTEPEGLPLDECLKDIRGSVRCVCAWRRFETKRTENGIDLGFAVTDSRALSRFLEGCSSILLFAMTAGREMDRIIARNTVISPLRGLLAHAAGAERVESACDRFCDETGGLIPGMEVRGRFSPGYGDLPLSMQKDVFSALELEKTLGLMLDPESLLMTPSKSVTAIAALREKKQEETEDENN